MNFAIWKILCTKSDDHDAVLAYDSEDGKALTDAVIGAVGNVAETTALPSQERHSLAQLAEIEADVLETAVLFKAMLSDKKGLTIAEVADLLSISPDLVRSLLDDGEVVGWRVRTRIVVSTKSLEDYLNENPY